LDRSSWDMRIVRILFVALIGGISAAISPFGLPPLPAAGFGLGVGVFACLVEARIKRAELRPVIGGTFGAAIGGLLALLAVFVLNDSIFLAGRSAQFFKIGLPLIGAYIGLITGVSKSDVLDLHALGFVGGDSQDVLLEKILDTSVLIDGRIADIAEAGFLDGVLLIPQFVLHELQSVADAADSAKRNRGRRGLDVVQRLQKMPQVSVHLVNQDFPSVREVDLKLIELAKARPSKIVTNDFNLNKLAQVQGVEVLNINELANALRPVVLPGEAMRVFIMKEGKEYNQGVAYLDDGTMVVVDNARRLISKNIDITVTSVLQTTAGKMIFGKYDERLQGTHEAQRAGTSGSNLSAAAGAD
jgi:uncharacterized protein YacL